MVAGALAWCVLASVVMLAAPAAAAPPPVPSVMSVGEVDGLTTTSIVANTPGDGPRKAELHVERSLAGANDWTHPANEYPYFARTVTTSSATAMFSLPKFSLQNGYDYRARVRQWVDGQGGDPSDWSAWTSFTTIDPGSDPVAPYPLTPLGDSPAAGNILRADDSAMPGTNGDTIVAYEFEMKTLHTPWIDADADQRWSVEVLAPASGEIAEVAVDSCQSIPGCTGAGVLPTDGNFELRWRVRAKDSGGTTSEWSRWRYIDTGDSSAEFWYIPSRAGSYRAGPRGGDEASGLVASKQYPGIYWAIRDAGGDENRAVLYALRVNETTGRLENVDGTVTKAIPVQGATNVDWESIIADDEGNLWVGDIGDYYRKDAAGVPAGEAAGQSRDRNNTSEPDVRLYRIPEPNPDVDDVAVVDKVSPFQYPDGHTWNTEALFTVGKYVYLITKEQPQQVFGFPAWISINQQTNTLRYLGDVAADLPPITGASMAAGNQQLALTTASERAVIYENPPMPSATLAQADALVRSMLVESTPDFHFYYRSAAALHFDGILDGLRPQDQFAGQPRQLTMQVEGVSFGAASDALTMISEYGKHVLHVPALGNEPFTWWQERAGGGSADARPVSDLTLRFETGWGTTQDPHLRASWDDVADQYEARWFYDQTAPEIEASGYAAEWSTMSISDNEAIVVPNEPGLTRKRWCVAVRSVGVDDNSVWTGPMCQFTQKCDDRLVSVMLGRGETPTAGDDAILGTNGDDWISALGGNDYVCPRGGDDWVAGGSGDDHVWASNGDDFVLGGTGADRLYGGSGADDMFGGWGNDYVNGNSGDDDLHGDGDDDTVLGYAGADHLDGGGGNDYLGGHSGTDTLHGGAGDDNLFGHGDADVLHGDDGNDRMFGSWGADVMFGGAGDDRMEAGNDNDVLYGGLGNDDLFGQADDDALIGGPGVDYGNGGSGSDGCKQVEQVFRCPLAPDVGTCTTNAQGLLECQTDTFSADTPCPSGVINVEVHKADAGPGNSYTVSVTSVDGEVSDAIVEVGLGQSAALQFAVPDGWYGLTVQNSDGTTLNGPPAIHVDSVNCHVPPWLVLYHPNTVTVSFDDWEAVRDGLRLYDHERMFWDQERNEYFIEVLGPDGYKFIAATRWAVELYIADGRCPIIRPGNCQDVKNRVLGIEYTGEINYVELPTGRWRIEWPNGTISFGDLEMVAVVQYMYGDRGNAGFSDDIVPDYILNDYWATWTPFQPSDLLGDIHFALDIAGMAPGIGEFADGINGIIYVVQGDFANAAISGVGMVPFGGQTATGARAANRARGVIEESAQAADGAISHVIRRADGTRVLATELADGSITYTAKNGVDLLGDIAQMDIAVARHLDDLGRHLDTPGPVISTVAVRQADGSYADLLAQPTQNLVDGGGRLIVDGVEHRGLRDLVTGQNPIVVQSGELMDIGDVPTYLNRVDEVFAAASPSGRGLHPDMRTALEGYVGNGQNIRVYDAGHAGGRFPGTHAEIVAVNEALHEGTELADIAVSSAWTNTAGARPPGTAALTCPNCAGILNSTPATVLTNFVEP